MKRLFEHWEDVKSILTSTPFVMTDYDGTLTPIVDRPTEAKLSGEMKKILSRLLENCQLAIISGRSLEDIKKRVGIQGIYYAGNHGLEISGPDLEHVSKEAKRSKSIVTNVCDSLEERLKSIDGVLVENKGLTASIHYRLVEDSKVPLMKEIFDESTEALRREGLIKVTRGKKVLEVRPNLDWDKGDAVRLLLRFSGQKEALPVYLGDDRTDESAFRVSRDEGGFGVLISSREKESEAEYRLYDIGEVRRFISRLIDYICHELDS